LETAVCNGDFYSNQEISILKQTLILQQRLQRRERNRKYIHSIGGSASTSGNFWRIAKIKEAQIRVTFEKVKAETDKKKVIRALTNPGVDQSS